LRSSNQPCLLIKGFMYNHVQTTCSGHSYFSTWSIFGWCLWGQMFAGTFPQVAFSSHSVSLNVKPWGWKSQRSWNATAGQMFRGIWTTSILFGLLASDLVAGNPQLSSSQPGGPLVQLPYLLTLVSACALQETQLLGDFKSYFTFNQCDDHSQSPTWKKNQPSARMTSWCSTPCLSMTFRPSWPVRPRRCQQKAPPNRWKTWIESGSRR
jgi:hypothetical protein